MPVIGERKFVIKHVYKNVMSLEKNKDNWEQPVIHYNVPWKVGVLDNESTTYFYVECAKPDGRKPWTIDTDIEMKLTKTNGETDSFFKKRTYHNLDRQKFYVKYFTRTEMNKYLIDGNVTAEFHVKINRFDGIESDNKIEGTVYEKLRNFDDDLAKEASDILLIVGGQKFYVNKMYLTTHSTYFKSLFHGNFNESKQSKIELKDINPGDFQNFLEVLYGEPAVEEDIYNGILKLADMYDSKTAIRRCEDFLLKVSKQPLKVKFEAAMKYKMDKLVKKCISEMKTADDVRSCLPKDPDQISGSIWMELVVKLLKFTK